MKPNDPLSVAERLFVSFCLDLLSFSDDTFLVSKNTPDCTRRTLNDSDFLPAGDFICILIGSQLFDK